MFGWQQTDVSHLEQPSVVGVVVLVLPSLRVHLVSLAGSVQLVGVVEQSRVQRVSIDQTHQVLPVVLPADTHIFSLENHTNQDTTDANRLVFV